MSLVVPDVLLALEPLIVPRGVVAIGELLGTVEFPALVEGLAKRAIEQGLRVVVGLELPMTEEPNTGSFGTFWRRGEEFRDGRSSEAMANLVRTLAPLDDVQLVSMDGPWVAPGSPVPLEMIAELERPRDETMAHRLLEAMDRVPKAFTVILAGSMHTRVLGGPAPTLGSVIRAWHPEMVALSGQAAGGDAWLLTRDTDQSGPYPLPETGVEAGAMWAKQPSPEDGHHGFVNLGRVTASAPFVPDD